MTECLLSSLQIKLPGKTSDSQESCRAAARKPNAFHRPERQNTKYDRPEFTKAKGETAYLSLIHPQVGSVGPVVGIGSSVGTNSEAQPLHLVWQHTTMPHHYMAGYGGVGVVCWL